MTIKYKYAIDPWWLLSSVYRQSMVWKEVPDTVEDIDPEDQIVWAMDDDWVTLTRGAQSKIRVPRGGLTFDRRRHD